VEQQGGQTAQLARVGGSVNELEQDLQGPLVGTDDDGVVFLHGCGHGGPL